ncbi:MAG: hypothetical protein PHW04_18630 [Candidatus Wallbacteria bacterium]|nr:hypothetical protein [Candidatus Wallbacteria bacterium]
MKLEQWDRKGWPPLHDLQLEELKDFTLPGGGVKWLVSDPDFLASYYFTKGFTVIFSSWHGLRRYDNAFMDALHNYIDAGGDVDDVGALEELPSLAYIFRIGQDLVRVEKPDLSSELAAIRNNLNAKFNDSQVVDGKMLEVWKSKLHKQKTKNPRDLLPFPGVQGLRAEHAHCAAFISNIGVALEISGDRKFRIQKTDSLVLANIDGFRMLVSVKDSEFID